MAFTIGRAGRSSPLLLNDPSVWAVQAGKVTLRVLSKVTPVSDAMRLRDQLLGYQDNQDEPVVPVIVDSEPRLTGYYHVTGVQLDTTPELVGLGLVEAFVSLEAMKGFAQPSFESILTDALLSNSVGAVIGDHAPFHAYPAVATEYAQELLIGGYATSTRSSSDGTMNVWCKAAGDATPMITTAHFYLAPSDYYVGAATIEQGSPLQPVVGEAVQPDLVNWRLSNGLVRVTPSATPGKIDVAHWKGAAWAAAKTYKFTEGNGGRGLITGWSGFTVTKNSPEECCLRLSATCAGGPSSPIYIDLSLHRGDRMVRGFVASKWTGGAPEWSVFRDAVEASTAITYGAVTAGGIRATANDADGNRFVLLLYQCSSTNDLVNGGITQSASISQTDFAIGSEIGGSGAAAIDTATVLARQYIAAQIEAQRLVGR